MADGQAEADILCADDRAELEEYKRIQANELEKRKSKIREEADRELANFRKSTEAVLVEQGVQQCHQQLDSVLQAFSNKAEFEFIRDHAIRLGIISRDDVVKPAAKRSRAEPRSRTAAQTVAGVRSRSVSRSGESRKRDRSASPPTLSKPTCNTSTPDPSAAQAMKEDTTPKASLVVALPQAQLAANISITPSIPNRTLGTSMHAPGNEMVDDSTPIPAPIPALDESFQNAMTIFFTTLSHHLQPLADKVEHLSNLVNGQTCPKHARTTLPPPHSSIPTLPTRSTDNCPAKQTTYPKPASGGGDSGGRNGSPQGEDNDSGRPSSDVHSSSAASNLNPITVHEKGGETRAPVEQSDSPAKSNRKSRAKKNVAIANAKVPGAAPAPTHTTQTSSRIAPTFVQVTTAQML